MIAFLADENFHGDIVRGLHRRSSGMDLVRVQDIGLRTLDDPTILEHAALLGRVLLTHDSATVPDFAYARVVSGQMMAGVLVVSRALPVGQAIEEILIMSEVMSPHEFERCVYYLPF